MSIENLRDILCKTTAQDMSSFQKQPSRDALRKSCSKNMQQIYRRTPMGKCDFNKVAMQVNYVNNASQLCKFLNLMYLKFSENSGHKL